MRTLTVLAMLPALSLAAGPLAAGSFAARSFAAGSFAMGARTHPSTTSPTLVLNVHVTVTNTRIVLDRRSAPRGVEARFIIDNATGKAHNITLNGANTTGGVQRGFSRTLAPHQRKIVRLFLDYRARVPYFGGLPADRGKAGMRGFFVIL